jgi:sulfate transport system ATP-binding protein
MESTMSIVLEQLTKRYEGHPVVNGLSLEIPDGEFFVLLGPSGSGKSTALRMVAGLTPVDGGRVLLHGQDVTSAPPQQRGVGFVFQHYALFRHMSVAENVEFALRVRKVASDERRRRREELLELVGLGGLGDRMPAQLSGGQQQRVALARALAHNPQVLLLDEPFGSLDARIRSELRRALRALQTRLGVTTIFVTHDQEEAFELADRLGVMNNGRLLEVGPPAELYRHPQTEFVASFLGTANLLVGRAMANGVQVGPLHFPLGTESGAVGSSNRVQVLFRPEDVALAATSESLGCPALGLGEVEAVTFTGSFERLQLRLPSIEGVRSIAPPVTYGDKALPVIATREQDRVWRQPLRQGDHVWVGVRRIHALVHPGLSFLVLDDGSAASQEALDFAGRIAQLASARLTVLALGEPRALDPQPLRERYGRGLIGFEVRLASEDVPAAVREAAERRPFDLVIWGAEPPLDETQVAAAEGILSTGEHHLLIVPPRCPVPTHALISVAGGEPGKEDVLFGGRLLRHLPARATLLSVLPPGAEAREQARIERFLESGERTLRLLGVPVERLVRSGPIVEEVLRQLRSGGHDLLILGAPLTRRQDQVTLRGAVRSLLGGLSACPVLIVHTPT